MKPPSTGPPVGSVICAFCHSPNASPPMRPFLLLLLPPLPTVLFRTLVICSETTSGATDAEIRNSSCHRGKELSKKPGSHDNRRAFIVSCVRGETGFRWEESGREIASLQ